MQLKNAEEFIVTFLQNGLSPLLHYHDLAHTVGVRHSCLSLAREEGIINEDDLVLLQTAALYHDCGFVNVYDHHEEEGCRLAAEILPRFEYNEAQIQVICNMIMKTKLPQNPVTHLEEILCDADLDHLGREDFDDIGKKLYEEWLATGKHISEKEWNDIQIKFLSTHSYWTASARAKRDQLKLIHLQHLNQLV